MWHVTWNIIRRHGGWYVTRQCYNQPKYGGYASCWRTCCTMIFTIILILILTNNSQSSSWSIAWMRRDVALYGAYAADVNLDSSALKDAVVDCYTTWHGSDFQSPTVRTAKWRNACVEEPTARYLNWCFALVLSSAATRPTLSGWIPTWPITTLYSKANLKSLRQLCKSCQPSSCNICVTLEVVR